jgi:GNAT superfamily N-acetyltransferase
VNITGEIRWHLGEQDYAHIKFSESHGAYAIDTVVVPAKSRRQGIGKQLIGRILALADTQDKEVYVSARPIGPTSEERLASLVTYYERFGFRSYDRGLTVIHMKRTRASERQSAP